MRSRSGLLLASALGAVLLLGVGCSGPARGAATPTPWPTPLVSAKPTYVVQRGTVVQSFTLTGQVVPKVWDALYFTVDGKLASLKVTDGMDVLAGDILAQLDVTSLTDQLNQAQISVQQAQDQFDKQSTSKQYAVQRAEANLRLQEIALERLQRSAAESRPVQLEQARKELEQARLALSKAQAEYDKVSWRSDIAALPQAAALEQATLAFAIAEDRYRLQTVSDLDLQIASQQIQVDLARLALTQTQEDVDPSLQRNLDKAKLQVETLQRQLGERQLRAPYAGHIVAVGVNLRGIQSSALRRPQVGDTINAFTPLVVIARINDLEINVPADSENATLLSAGDVVSVTHRATAAQPFQARVIAIPVQILSSGDKPAQPQAVRIALPDDAPLMAIGDYVDVNVVNKVSQNTLFLPRAAVRQFSGRSFVVIRAEGRDRRADVTLGLINATHVEILSGVHEGDVIVGQ